ncbi:MAG: lytic transglycosylase domain-containing protein [Acidobacteria bacterium]|nr:lytic transglycosylase domain-containing protein [Acidobacteriota bacterium]
MRRFLPFVLLIAVAAVISAIGAYYFNEYWIHRYDELIARQARIYSLDEKLVWSVIYEETYFRAWKIGAAEEVGLMQVTPTVARAWAKETGFHEFEKQTAENVNAFLSDPERNIQVGCWYLEKLREKYRGYSAEESMTLAAYNAGPSRVEEWSKPAQNPTLMSEQSFIEKINIPSTKSYVTAILGRYREVLRGK